MDEGAEVPPEELLGPPAGEPFACVRQEGERGVRPDRPDQVGRVLDEVAVAPLGVGQALDKVRVGDRDRGLVGQRLEHVKVLGFEGSWLAVRDRQRPDHALPGRAERGRRHAAQPEPVGGGDVVLLERDALVGQVVRGPDRRAVAGGEAVDPLAQREALRLDPVRHAPVAAGDHDRDQHGRFLVEPREMGTVGCEQALGLLDDLLEDLARVAQRGDPRGDIAERSLALGAELDLGARTRQLGDQAGIGHRDRGLVGKAAEHGRVDLVELGGLGAEDLDRAERAVLADDRRRDQRVDAAGLGQPVGFRRVDERIGRQVIVDHDHPPLRDGLARHALAELAVRVLQPAPLGLRQARVVRPVQRPIGGVVQLEQCSVGAQQAGRLPDHVLEEVAGLADRGDPRGDLAQCLLVRGAPFDDGLGALELLHQAGVDERDRGLARQTGEQLGVDLAVHVRRPGHHRDHADGSLLAGERRGEDRADARLLDEARDPVGRLEAVVGRVIGRDERPLLGEREPSHALARLQSARDRPVGDVLHRLAGRVAPAQDPQLVVVQVDPRAVRLEEPCRLVDDPLEDLAGIEDRGDARVDLAQRPLRVGAPRDLLARTFELLDQARVHDRHRALVGQRAEHGGVLGAECTRLVAVDGQHAEDLVVAHERGRDHRADARVADEGVAFRRVREALVVRGSRRSTRPGGSAGRGPTRPRPPRARPPRAAGRGRGCGRDPADASRCRSACSKRRSG